MVVTEPGIGTTIEKNTLYSVRHQVVFTGGVNYSRFRIWPAEDAEPSAWLCEESDSEVADSFVKFRTGSFGLFQYSGPPTEWSNIKLREIVTE